LQIEISVPFFERSRTVHVSKSAAPVIISMLTQKKGKMPVERVKTE
jgi:hypothetical protein